MNFDVHFCFGAQCTCTNTWSLIYVTRSFETLSSNIPAAGCSIVSAGTSIVQHTWFKQREQNIVSGKISSVLNINIHPRHSVGLEFSTRLVKLDPFPQNSR